MRKSYYDNSDREDRTEGTTPPAWRPGERPRPYGDVPGAIPPAETPSAILPRQRQTAARKNGAGGVAGFALFLVALFLLVGAGIVLRGGLDQSALSLGDLWDRLDPRNGWEDITPWGNDGEWDYYEEDDDWLSDLPNTTARRAPVGTGVTLTVTTARRSALTPQAIYQKVNPAVVQVRSYLRNGYALGTGVVMDETGYIITNAHVIAGARRIDVVLYNGRRASALLVGYDGSTDLAVLKVEVEGLVVAEFGDSAALTVGDPAYAIGNPLGDELRGTLTDGIISAIDRSVSTDEGEQTLLQTTAALNSGNSGGALINEYGQVVGITNMKMMSDYETIEGLGFAIPTSVVKPVVDQLIETGSYVGKPMLGITVFTVEAGEAGENSPAGVYIDSVDRRYDAWRQGVRAGDIILSANGVPVEATEDLLAVKNALSVGDVLTLELWREGETLTADVTLIGSNQS